MGMALRFSIMDFKDNCLESIRTFFFGPSVRVPVQIKSDKRINSLLDEFLSIGLSMVTCIHTACGPGEKVHLRGVVIQMKAIGASLIGIITQSGQLMTI